MRRRALVAAGLIFAAFNLRTVIAAVSPVLPQLQRSEGLSSTGAGALNAVPIICFGAFALTAPALDRRFGPDRLLWLTLAGVLAGTGLRLAPDLGALFGGTVVIGASIGVANVILPGLVKRDFPDRVSLMTGLYGMALTGGGALAAGVTVPVEHLGGMTWRPALACWGIPVIAALVLWRPGGRGREVTPPAAPGPGLLGSGLAWAVTAFMGVQSFGFYATFTWIPTVLEDAGMRPAAAGAELSLSAVVSIAAAFAVPALARRARRRWMPVVLMTVLYAAGMVGLAADHHGTAMVAVCMVVLGAGQGAALGLALGFIVRRAADARQAGQLSTMAQGIGYLFACTGPFAVGALHQLTGDWTVPLAVVGAIVVPSLVLSGVIASADRHVTSVAR